MKSSADSNFPSGSYPGNEKLTNLQTFIHLVCPLPFFIYSTSPYALASTTAKNSDILRALLALDFHIADSLADFSAFLSTSISKQTFPIIQNNSLDIIWVADIEIHSGYSPFLHIMGPVFTDTISISKIEKRLGQLKLSTALRHHFLNILKEFPVLPMSQLLQYTVMLHYSLTGERISMESLFHSLSTESGKNNTDMSPVYHSGNYFLKQQILSYVREGNLSYRPTMKHFAFTQPGKLTDENQLRQSKDLVIIFTALCTQAAIEGGLSPESAYLISDYYIQQTESETSIQQLGNISHTMLEDFIQRVHRVKTHRISPQIQKICDRIQLHPEEKNNVHTIASNTGYSDYYLSKKFKTEMGCSIKEYINQQKIEKAKQLLTSTSMTIGQIADELNICSQSYFGNLFFQHTGMTPSEYKNRSGL